MFGWHPVYVNLWKDFEGTVLSDRLHLLFSHVLTTVRKAIWQQASSYYSGKGLDSEPADVSIALARLLRAAGMVEPAALLECILSGGRWLPDRVAAAYPTESELCPLCGLKPGTPMHCFWRCPCLLGLYFPEVDSTQKYADQAFAEPEFECFWLHGLLPFV